MGIVQETRHWKLIESRDLIQLKSKWGPSGLAFANWDEVQEVCSILFHALPPPMRPWMAESQSKAALSPIGPEDLPFADDIIEAIDSISVDKKG